MLAQYTIAHALHLPIAQVTCIDDMSASELTHHIAFLKLQREGSS